MVGVAVLVGAVMAAGWMRSARELQRASRGFQRGGGLPDMGRWVG